MFPAVANVAEVTAPDPGTVLIKFKKVSPEVFDLLQAMAIIEPSAMDSLKNRGSGTGPVQVRRVGPRRPHDPRAQHRLLGAGRAVGRPRGLQGLQRLGRHGGGAPVGDLRPDHRRAAQGHGAPGQGVQHGPGHARGPDLRGAGQRRQAAVRQEGGAPGPPLRDRPPGHREQRALRRERADGAPVQPELAGLRPLDPGQVPVRPEAGEGDARQGGPRGRPRGVPDPAAVPRAAGDLPGAQGRPREDRVHARHRRPRLDAVLQADAGRRLPDLPVVLREHAEVPDAGRAQQHLSAR